MFSPFERLVAFRYLRPRQGLDELADIFDIQAEQNAKDQAA